MKIAENNDPVYLGKGARISGGKSEQSGQLRLNGCIPRIRQDP